MPEKLFQPTDSRKFRAQVAQLLRKGYRVTRLSSGELKVGRHSYFPDTGAIWRGQATKLRQRGFSAFIDTIEGKIEGPPSKPRSVDKDIRDEAKSKLQTLDLSLLFDEKLSDRKTPQAVVIHLP